MNQPCDDQITETETTKHQRLQWLIVCLLLSAHTGLLIWSAMVHSPNMNEPCHMVAGIAHWQYGRFDLYSVNPPLVRLIATLPVVVAGSNTNWSEWDDTPRSRPEFRIGPDWVAANGRRALSLTTLARIACIPFSLAGGFVCYLWGREIYGGSAGILSCTLWAFSPTMLGHASCITPDAHAAAVGLIANFLFWRWLRKPNWGRATATGLFLGFALLSKLTWIVLIPLWPILCLIWHLTSRTSQAQPPKMHYFHIFGQLLLIIALGCHVTNHVYGYDDAFHPLGGHDFVSTALKGQTNEPTGNIFTGYAIADAPVPLPSTYIKGIDLQKYDHERRPVTYFRGELLRRGLPYFYLYALSIKLPIGTLMLLATAAVLSITRSNTNCTWQDHAILLAPSLTIILIASCEPDYTTHFRYILPAIPPLFVWAGRTAILLSSTRIVNRILILAPLLWAISSSLWFSPHWLSYFNEFAGGPTQGHLHIANSNIDWGQDLLHLEQWIASHPEAQPLGLAYYGMFHPNSIGFVFDDVPGWITEPTDYLGNPSQYDDPLNIGPLPGWYAVSTNLTLGHPARGYRADGSTQFYHAAYFTWLNSLTPVDHAGYSILIYHVTEDDVMRLQDAS